MRYEAAVDWLFSRFPSYQNLGASAYKPDLTNVSILLHALYNPQRHLRCVHIAGTNGKGSTSHILAALCQTSGLKVGIFTSPHLVDFRERIKVNGVCIPEKTVIDWVERVIPSLEIEFEPSFFELTTAFALLYFEEQSCDICIIETGLGGRLDATNIISPVLSVITNIGYDHQNFLGDTRAQIAFEKAGIIKPVTPILIAEKDEETKLVFESKVSAENALLRWVDFGEVLESDLLGAFQQLNLNTAKQAFDWLCELIQIQSTDDNIRYALKHVAKLTGFRGRMELVQSDPKIIFDVAHNISGIRVLLRELEKIEFNRLHIVFGTANDKDLSDVFPILPTNASYYLCQFNNSRSRTLKDWETLAIDHFAESVVYINPILALNAARSNANTKDLILVFGSFFLIGELLENEHQWCDKTSNVKT